MAQRRSSNRKNRSNRRNSGRRSGGGRSAAKSNSNLFFWGAVGTILLAGAGYLFILPNFQRPAAACVLLVDRTGSSDIERTVASYEELGRRAIEGCSAWSAELAMYYFDQEQQKLVAAGDGDPFDLTRNGSRNAAMEALQAVMEQPTGDARNSDILVPMGQAADVLRDLGRRHETSSLHLVVLTDGIHQGTQINVWELGGDPESAAALVNRAEQLRLVPELGGIGVDMVGSYTGLHPENGGLTDDSWEASVERFWQMIVERGGGVLCSYRTDAPYLPTGC